MASTSSLLMSMDISEVLKLADELVFAKTGKHLDYLQEAILRGTLEERTYWQIAEEVYASPSHIRNVGYELWQILSNGLGKNVSKANFRYILEKSKHNIIYFQATINTEHHVTIKNVNICPDSTPKTTTQPTPDARKQLHLDLGNAPEICNFYGRESEINTLQQWITEHRCRLIALLGISGMGKTALAIRLIESIKSQFDYIIYRSFRFSPTPEATCTNLLQIFADKDINHSLETQLSQILQYFRQHRCLIIFDDLQMLFSSQQLAGQYKSGYEDYQQFFQLISEVSHHSCVMLISSEKPRDIAQQEKDNHWVRSFVVEGLGKAAKEILRAQKLGDEARWENLINMYQGNPLWLKLTATMIQDLCGGSVSEFWQYDSLILDEFLQDNLNRHFLRLTEPESKILLQLANEDEPVALPQLSQTINLSISELIPAIQSLLRRFFLETKNGGNATCFGLNPVLKQYVKNRR